LLVLLLSSLMFVSCTNQEKEEREISIEKEELSTVVKEKNIDVEKKLLVMYLKTQQILKKV